MEIYEDDQTYQRRDLTSLQVEYFNKGEVRALNKYDAFIPNLFIEDDKHRKMRDQIKRVIEAHPSSADETFNPRFLEVYVETVFFCQIVRRYNKDTLLTHEQLNNVFDWLSEIVNSFVHF